MKTNSTGSEAQDIPVSDVALLGRSLGDALKDVRDHVLHRQEDRYMHIDAM